MGSELQKSKISTVGLLVACSSRASACMVCTSNLSYNGLRFTALWVLMFLCWCLVLVWIQTIYQRNYEFAEALKPYRRGFTRYLITLVVLYFVLGMHLGAIVLLPLVMVWLWFRYARQLKSASEPAFKTLHISHWVMIALLALAIPVSLKLPRVIGEPDTRVTVNRIHDVFKSIIQSASFRPQNADLHDPFARIPQRMPILGWIVMNNSFYQVDENDKYFHIVNTGPRTLVWSRGPNSTFDINDNLAGMALATANTPDVLVSLTYDPTNGIVSPGDIWLAR